MIFIEFSYWLATFIVLVCIYILRKVFSKELSLQGKYVLITGCDHGFGYHTSLKMNKKKAFVFSGCLTKAGVAQLQNDNNFKGKAFLMDVTNENDINTAFELIKKKVGDTGLWCLVNNAGVFVLSPLEWQSTESMKRVMDVNLWGTVNVTKKMLPLLKSAKGRVVNLTSMAGRISLRNGISYSMSKYAIEAFSDGLRYEMAAWDVSVHILEPGMFATDILNCSKLEQELKELYNAQSNEMKEIYGEDYLKENATGFIHNVQILACKNMNKVVNSIAHAATSTRPNARYVVGVDANTIWILLTYLPTCIGDFIGDVIAPLPTPKQMQK